MRLLPSAAFRQGGGPVGLTARAPRTGKSDRGSAPKRSAHARLRFACAAGSVRPRLGFFLLLFGDRDARDVKTTLCLDGIHRSRRKVRWDQERRVCKVEEFERWIIVGVAIRERRQLGSSLNEPENGSVRMHAMRDEMRLGEGRHDDERNADPQMVEACVERYAFQSDGTVVRGARFGRHDMIEKATV